MEVNIKLKLLDRIIEFFFPLYGAQRRRARAMMNIASKAEPTRRRVISGGLGLTRETNHSDLQGHRFNQGIATDNFTNSGPSYHNNIEQFSEPQEDDSQDRQWPTAPPQSPQDGDRRRDFAPQRPMKKHELERMLFIFQGKLILKKGGKHESNNCLGKN